MDTLDKIRIAGCGALALALAACGGGGGTAPAALAADGAAAPTITLSRPRAVNLTDRLAFAWTPAQFDDALFVRIEQGLSFLPSTSWTLERGGTGVTIEDGMRSADGGPAHVEFSYEQGFFVITSLEDREIPAGLPYGVDVYPSAVEPVTPANPCGSGATPCYNGYGFFSWLEWPSQAGSTVSLAIPRSDPSGLRYELLWRESEGAAPRSVATVTGTLTTTLPRGPAWGFDFPTATAAVRGCDPDGRCTDSAEQPLRAALLDSVRRLDAAGAAPNADVAMSEDGQRIAVRTVFGNAFSPEPALLVYTPDERGRLGAQASVTGETAGFARHFSLSGDGRTLAIEESSCDDAAGTCDTSVLRLLRANAFGWADYARLPGLRAPRLNRDGTRLAAIRLPQGGPETIVLYGFSADAWREETALPTSVQAFDLALAADGATLAVARRGDPLQPCGCTGVSLFRRDVSGQWLRDGDVHPGRPLGVANAPGLAINGDGTLVAVGASHDFADAGGVHLYQRASGGWQQQALVRPAGAVPGDRFGRRVALSSDGLRLVVLARGLATGSDAINRVHALPRPNGGIAGHVFMRAANGPWEEQAVMVPRVDAPVQIDGFAGLAISGDASRLALNTGPTPRRNAPAGTTAFVY